MPLNKESLKELKEILNEDYKIELSEKELFEVGSTLISYFELLSRIYFREKLRKDLTLSSKAIK